MSLPLLSLCTFVPLLGALAILLMPSPNNARWIALGTTIVTFVFSLMVSLAAVASDKSDTGKGTWIKGWVSDSKCGAKGAGLGHEACGTKCLQAGEHVVFVDDVKHKVLSVDNPDALKDHMGHRVAVQGAVDEGAGTIHVDKVNMITQGSKKAAAASMDEMHK